jgi:regulator of RNase E activity RraA
MVTSGPSTTSGHFGLVARMGRLPTSVISDQRERFGAVMGLHTLCGTVLESRLTGPALTVLTRPGDNLAVHQAIDLAQPGDVLVVNAGGHVDRAVTGEIVYRYAVSRGIAGVVIDGAVRDGAEIAAGTAPVFSRGVTHAGPWKNGPGEIRGPVAIGGTVVCCGDLVVGDGDGLVVGPRHRLAQVVDGGGAAAGERGIAIGTGRGRRAGQVLVGQCHPGGRRAPLRTVTRGRHASGDDEASWAAGVGRPGRVAS